jgi:hypothetical protein
LCQLGTGQRLVAPLVTLFCRLHLDAFFICTVLCRPTSASWAWISARSTCWRYKQPVQTYNITALDHLLLLITGQHLPAGHGPAQGQHAGAITSVCATNNLYQTKNIIPLNLCC